MLGLCSLTESLSSAKRAATRFLGRQLPQMYRIQSGAPALWPLFAVLSCILLVGLVSLSFGRLYGPTQHLRGLLPLSSRLLSKPLVTFLSILRNPPNHSKRSLSAWHKCSLLCRGLAEGSQRTVAFTVISIGCDNRLPFLLAFMNSSNQLSLLTEPKVLGPKEFGFAPVKCAAKADLIDLPSSFVYALLFPSCHPASIILFPGERLLLTQSSRQSALPTALSANSPAEIKDRQSCSTYTSLFDMSHHPAQQRPRQSSIASAPSSLRDDKVPASEMKNVASAAASTRATAAVAPAQHGEASTSQAGTGRGQTASSSAPARTDIDEGKLVSGFGALLGFDSGSTRHDPPSSAEPSSSAPPLPSTEVISSLPIMTRYRLIFCLS